jgi:SAM-dependent MidA family methyltransferase
MASLPSVESGPSPAFLRAFAEQAAPLGRLSFADYMQLALYHPEVGYYRQPRRRVGYGGETDFYTAATSAPLFGELVAATAVQLLAQHGQSAQDFEWIEIGAEPGEGVLRDGPHPFRAARTIPVGAPLQMTGKCVVFSNELFDAQPCSRFVRTEQGWAESWVEGEATGLRERLVPADALPPWLPEDSPVGYRIDAPEGAAALTATIADQPWQGLFLAFDYGKTWAELATETSAGTARAYHRHRQVLDLLARPGEQDLTCHICWDWMTAALERRGFITTPVLAQEAFLVTHAAPLLEEIMSAERAAFSQRKLALLQLLHPAHLGQKFQVLSAWRG